MKILHGEVQPSPLRFLSRALPSAFILFMSLLFIGSPVHAFTYPPGLPGADHPLGQDTLAFTPELTATIFLPSVLHRYSPIQPGPCGPGQSITDPALDVSSASIDVTEMRTTLQGENLQVVFHLRDVPEQLTFDRIGVPENRLEYEWSVYIDIDNNPQTGSSASNQMGTEYSLSVMHFVFDPDKPKTKPIPDGVQVNVWRYNPTLNRWTTISKATLSVDSPGDTLAITGAIPGIGANSRLVFQTLDQNPGGAVIVDVPSTCNPPYDSAQR